MSALTVESDRERHLAERLRVLAVREIETIGVERAAQALEIAPTGVRSLLWHQEWSIETAFRIADALDLEPVRSWQGALEEAASDNGKT